VSPWKGVVRFGKKGTLAPRFVGPFKIIRRIGPIAYRLRLLEELNGVHDTFHPVEILEREFKKLKRSRIAIVKQGKQDNSSSNAPPLCSGGRHHPLPGAL
ncbi:hypothetical protein Tco_1427205, partial [Tanacetum coccineum]